MRRSLQYVVIGLVAYLVFVVATVPAARVYAWISQGQLIPVQLYGVTGTVWHGRALQARIGRQTLDSVTWSWRPSALLRGRIGATVDALYRQQAIAINAGLSVDRTLVLSGVNASVDVTAIEDALYPDPLGLTGMVEIDLKDVRLQSGRLTALQGDVRWNNGGLGPPVNIAIGSYLASFVTEKNIIHGTVRDTDGPVIVNGNLELQRNGQYQLTASLAARDAANSQVRQALGAFGTPSPEGKVTIRKTGMLDLPVLLGMRGH